MKKIKHSKFKNTGFLFELLVRQVTADILSNNKETAERILKEYFNNKKELSKELKLYQFLLNEKYNSETKAQKFIDTICEARKRLDEKKLTKEKYNLIKEISANYNIDEFVKSPISNYKILASIYKIFESNITKTEYDRVDVLNANFTITENIINASVKNKGDKLKDVVIEEYKKQSDDVRSLTYNLMIEKFNNKYKGLSDSQKLVLREYINNINNTGKLKQFVSEQISSIISELKVIEKKLTDKVTKIKLNETIETVKKIKGIKSIRENHMSAVMMAYELIKELKSKL